MPIPVACRCGKSFAAKDELAGKVIQCPACQQPLQIPAPGQQGARPAGGAAPRSPAAGTPAATPDGKIVVACGCGARFAAGAELAGKQVKCPKCGQALTVGAGAAPAAAAAAGVIPVVCACGAKFGAKPELQGKTVKCPKCGQALTVGAGAAAVAATAASPNAGGLGGDPELANLLDEIGLKPKATGENACPGCGAFMAPEAVLCIECGFDRKAKRKVTTQTVKKAEARKLSGPPRDAAKGTGNAAGGGSSMPWEDAEGNFSALGATVRAVLSSPQEAFGNLRPDGLRLAVGYYFTTALLMGLILAILFGGAIAALSGGNNMGTAGVVAGIMLGYVLISSAISFLLHGAIYHGLLMLVGGANRSISTTYQVMGYCGGAANVVVLCPCLSILAVLIAFYSIPFGMAAAHKTTLGKSYTALLLLIILGAAFQFVMGTALQTVISQFMPEPV